MKQIKHQQAHHTPAARKSSQKINLHEKFQKPKSESKHMTTMFYQSYM